MTQDDWRAVFLQDVRVIPTAVSLRRWAADFGEEIRTRCPDHVNEIRAAYVERLAELQKACKP